MSEEPPVHAPYTPVCAPREVNRKDPEYVELEFWAYIQDVDLILHDIEVCKTCNAWCMHFFRALLQGNQSLKSAREDRDRTNRETLERARDEANDEMASLQLELRLAQSEVVRARAERDQARANCDMAHAERDEARRDRTDMWDTLLRMQERLRADLDANDRANDGQSCQRSRVTNNLHGLITRLGDRVQVGLDFSSARALVHPPM